MKLEIKNINKQFVTNKGYINSLSNINVAICLGDFVCIVGPSGCGKSTLLNLIAGLTEPTSGEIHCPGKIGFLFQEPTLFPWLSVKDNVAFNLKIRGIKKFEIKKKVDYYLHLVHLTPFENAYPHELSGGMCQRVALARMLIMEPDILLMDEPFCALDAQTRELLYGELQDIWRLTQKTIVFVTHNVREAVCLGNRILVFTARPGTIKREFVVDFPRPREINNLEVTKISAEIQKELKEEIQQVIKEMEHYEAKNSFSR